MDTAFEYKVTDSRDRQLEWKVKQSDKEGTGRNDTAEPIRERERGTSEENVEN
jgi:hypothetical protein